MNDLEKEVEISRRTKEIISDEEIDRVHAYSNFGDSLTKRDVVALGLLKAASGYYQGHTSTQIITEHKLIDADYKLTAKGRTYLWEAFGDGKF